MKNVQATGVFLTGVVRNCDFLALLFLNLGCCSYAALQLRPEAAAVRLRSLDAAKSEKEYETRKSRRKGLLGLWGPLRI